MNSLIIHYYIFLYMDFSLFQESIGSQSLTLIPFSLYLHCIHTHWTLHHTHTHWTLHHTHTHWTLHHTHSHWTLSGRGGGSLFVFVWMAIWDWCAFKSCSVIHLISGTFLRNNSPFQTRLLLAAPAYRTTGLKESLCLRTLSQYFLTFFPPALKNACSELACFLQFVSYKTTPKLTRKATLTRIVIFSLPPGVYSRGLVTAA